MATKLFFRNGQVNTIAPGVTDAHVSDNAARELTTGAGAGLTTDTVTSVTGPTSGVMYANWWSTPPVTAGVTISNTITFNLWGLESSMNANTGLEVQVYRIKPDGTSVLIVDSEFGTELNTSAAVNNWTATPTSTALNVGDCLGVLVLANDAGGTMASGFTISFGYNGGSAGANGDSFISFTEAISFATGTPAGTTLLVTDDASDLTISGENTRALVTSTSAAAASATTNTVNGPTAAINMTRTAGDSNYLAWYSQPIASPTTLAAPISLVASTFSESNGAANAVLVAFLYATNGDGSSPTLVSTVQFAAEGAGSTATFVGAPFTISAGQRLKIVFAIDDATSARTTANMATGFTTTLNFSDSGTTSLRLRFTDSLTFGASGKALPFSAQRIRPNMMRTY